MGYCFWYTIVFGIGTWQTSWATTGNANTVPVFEAKFGWTKDETMLYNTIISTAGIIGITVGSFIGGVLLKFGRRRIVIISQLIAIAGALVSMIVHVSTLTIGRFLLGTGAGAMNIAFGKLINENIP